jgi:cation/acetate symporter
MTSAATTRRWPLHAALLALWFAASFGWVFFARDLQWVVGGWPIGYWISAQGLVLIFVAIVAVFAWAANRREVPDTDADIAAYATYRRGLHHWFARYLLGLILFLSALAVAEHWGLPKAWVAGIFLAATLLLYAAIGVFNRTSNAAEYYVAGRRIPAVYCGMATAADWMSAASFISLAGGLYLQGFSGKGAQAGGLAYVLGWTGGFCLVALLVAPYLRRMQLYTVPDYFAVRFGGRWPRTIAAMATVLCSFTYLVAQIFGVGLIVSRLTGLQFDIGIFVGLGGVLVCSFLGGMRAVTWTQVTQYVVIILAFLIPVSWLAYKQVGNPLAPLSYAQQLQTIGVLEQRLLDSHAEQEVQQVFAQRANVYAAKLQDVDAALLRDRDALRTELRGLDLRGTEDGRVVRLRKELAALPTDVVAARQQWTQELAENRERAKPMGGMPPHALPFDGNPTGTVAEQQSFDTSRLNFLALVFCLMVGTAGLPHLLTRFYTTPSVAEARTSVAWSLFFIALLYMSAPALAVLVKYEVMAHLVGLPFDQLPGWVAQWARDPSLLAIADVNADHILQFSEIKMGADVVMLATPEIGGLPYVVTVLVAVGGLAAALSTADGLLLTIGNAMAHDVIPDNGASKAQAMRRVMWSKFALLVVALLAAYTAALRPAGILYLVSASFSLAGAAFVPAMVLGIFWPGTSRSGAVAGMLTGLGVTLYYLVVNLPAVRAAFQLRGDGLWWGVQPVSAGVFGVTAGLLVTLAVSLIAVKAWPGLGGDSPKVHQLPR